VGKSTLLKMIKDKNMNYVTLDDLEARNLALKDPKYFLDYYSYPLIIDEIQYTPNLLSYIKIIVDQEKYDSLVKNKPIQPMFWLTGSQHFNIMKNINESLAGRIGILNLGSLFLSEINEHNNPLFLPKIEELKKRQLIQKYNSKEIFKFIFRGGMPDVVTGKISRDDFFSSYINTYIEKDVRKLLNIEKSHEFYNFIQYLAARTAQEVNYNSISRAIGVSNNTIKGWISILEGSGLIFYFNPIFLIYPIV
jgi:predicted AAA+ superfamily ATPase